MQWVDAILDERAAPEGWAYRKGALPATEPASLAAMALAAHGRLANAQLAAQWLAEAQSDDGSVGISAEHPQPAWPTPLAVQAWRSIDQAALNAGQQAQFATCIEKATRWMLGVQGKPLPRHADIGHDTTLLGWPWVEGTHSWLEPTAHALLALKAVGLSRHARAREAARLLVDRTLPGGGCNYGNTSVLGQMLRPQLAPTGIALVALTGEEDNSGRVKQSLDYVESQLNGETTAESLAYALLGLAAHGRPWPQADAWLQRVAASAPGRGASLPRLTLLTLAAAGERCPLIALARPAKE